MEELAVLLLRSFIYLLLFFRANSGAFVEAGQQNVGMSRKLPRTRGRKLKRSAVTGGNRTKKKKNLLMSRKLPKTGGRKLKRSEVTGGNGTKAKCVDDRARKKRTEKC